jgi:hypothetical protein
MLRIGSQHNYFSNTNATTTASSIPSAANGTLSAEGQALCNPFAWVDVGIMGGLWVLLLLAQGYFL